MSLVISVCNYPSFCTGFRYLVDISENIYTWFRLLINILKILMKLSQVILLHNIIVLILSNGQCACFSTVPIDVNSWSYATEPIKFLPTIHALNINLCLKDLGTPCSWHPFLRIQRTKIIIFFYLTQLLFCKHGCRSRKVQRLSKTYRLH